MSTPNALTNQDHLDAVVVNLLNTDPDWTVLVIAGSLLCSVPVRIIIRESGWNVCQNAVLLIISIVLVFLMRMSEVNTEKIEEVLKLPPHRLFHVYIPIFITSAIYHLDYYEFGCILPQLMVIVLVGCLIAPFAITAVFTFMLHKDWSYSQAFVAALVSLSIQPLHIVKMLKNIAKYRYLATILDAESIFMLVPITILFTCLTNFAVGYYQSFQQTLSAILYYFVGGFAMGLIMGVIQKYLMIWLYNDPSYALCVSIGLTFFTYFFCEYFYILSGTFAVLIMNCMIGFEKHQFTTEVDECLTNFWSTMHYLVEMTSLMLCTGGATFYVMDCFDVRKLYGTFIIFLSINTIRLISFFIMMPILKFMKYEMNFKCILILGCSNLKGSINVNLLLLLFQHKETMNLAKHYIIEIMMFTFLSILFNSIAVGVLLQTLGLTGLTDTRKVNMEYFMQILMRKRFEIINILKMNRFLGLSNWQKARNDTYLPHFYQELIRTKDDVKPDDEDTWKNDKTTCPACTLDFTADMSEDELALLIRETANNVLRAKKISIVRQFENGVINKYCLHVLVHNFDLMLESTNNKANILEASGFLRPGKFLLFLRKIFERFVPTQIYFPPTLPICRMCFYLVMHYAYDPVMYTVIIINCVVANMTMDDDLIQNILFSHYFFTTSFFTAEVVVKIFAYSMTHMFFSGIKPYFKSKRNIFDFTMLILSWFYVYNFRPSTVSDWIFYHVIPAYRTIAVIRLLTLVCIVCTFCPTIVNQINTKIDKKLCFQFQLATALLLCIDEILENIKDAVQVAMLRDIIRRELLDERANLAKKMQVVQNEKPLVSITVKTKQAIRTSLQVMEHTLKECKTSGLVDEIEYMFIYKKIFDQQKNLKKLLFVPPSSPKSIFNEIIWIKDSVMGDKIMDYLYQNSQIVHFDSDQVICRSNQKAKGIYILVTGLVRLTYKPRNFPEGRIPVIDYLNTLNLNDPINEIILPGSTIGELCFLTGYNYDCNLYTEVPTKAYYLSADILREAAKMSPNPVNGLEARMWKCSIINWAIAIMLNVPYYQSYRVDEIRLKLEKCFVPKLTCYKIFAVTEMMDDVILIEGMAADYATMEIFTAPKLIPKAVQKLVFPKSNLLNVETKVETRLVIIPMGEAKDIEIMEQEEDRAEFAMKISSNCLLRPADAKRINAKHREIMTTIDYEKRSKRVVGSASVDSVDDETESEIDEYYNILNAEDDDNDFGVRFSSSTKVAKKEDDSRRSSEEGYKFKEYLPKPSV